MGSKTTKCRMCGRQRNAKSVRYKVCESCRPAWEAKNARRLSWSKAKQAAYERLEDEGHSGKCDICGRGSSIRRHGVDTEHKTFEVRGLLCYFCNFGLRWFRDDPALLRQAAAYIEKGSRFSLKDVYPDLIVGKSQAETDAKAEDYDYDDDYNPFLQ